MRKQLFVISLALLLFVGSVLAIPLPQPTVTTASTTTTTTTTTTDPSSLSRGGGATATKKVKIIQTKRGNKAVTTTKAPTTTTVAGPTKGAGTWLYVPTDAIVGAIVMALIERAVKQVFISNDVSFPAQLAGCIVLFFSLLVADVIIPNSGKAIYDALTPGTNLLTKWLPVFFVPGLAMLPLAPSVGSSIEVAKVLLVTGLGFLYSLFTVAYSVLFLRLAEGKVVTPPPPPTKKLFSKLAPASSSTPVKPFSDNTMNILSQFTLFSGIASVLTQTILNKSDAIYATPLQTFFFFCVTCSTYVWGARLPVRFTKLIHPLLTSTGLTWAVLYWYGIITDKGTFMDMIKSYKVGSMKFDSAGAGDILLFLLGPSVVSFAISMYSRKQLLKENFLIVIASMLVSSLGALFGTAIFSKLIGLGSTSDNGLMIRLSMLARNVTTALAIPITQILNGDVSIAVVVVVLTGIIGAQYGRRLLDMVGIRDPVTRGLAVGSSAQGLGVSSMVPEPDAFPFAAMAMVLTAVAGTVFVSIPQIKDALVSLSS